MMNQFEKISLALLALVVGGICLGLLRGRGRDSRTILRPEVSNLEETLQISGFIFPEKEIDVKSQSSGVVDSVFVAIGDVVREGTPIASVRLVPNSSEVERLTYDLKIARINLEASQVKFERQKNLWEARAISKAEFEQAQQELRTATENHTSARRQLRLRRSGGRATGSDLVRASTAGVVIDIPVKVGSSVMERSPYNAGSPVATIAGTGCYVFRSSVPEKDLARLRQGMEMELSISALSALRVRAVITKISAKGEKEGGAVKFPVEATFSASQGAGAIIRSGYSATAKVVVDSARGVLSLPEKCIRFQGDTAYVWVEDPARHGARRVDVRLGITGGDKVEVREGLSLGDAVLANPDAH